MKMPKQEYTEFRELAVRRIKEGVKPGALRKELGVNEQTLCNWVKAADAGKLNKEGGKIVTPEQMELSRLRAENNFFDLASSLFWQSQYAKWPTGLCQMAYWSKL